MSVCYCHMQLVFTCCNQTFNLIFLYFDIQGKCDGNICVLQPLCCKLVISTVAVRVLHRQGVGSQMWNFYELVWNMRVAVSRCGLLVQS